MRASASRRRLAAGALCAVLHAWACGAETGPTDAAVAPPEVETPRLPSWDELRADIAAKGALALGATAVWTPNYAGSTGNSVQPRLVWAFQYGRVRLSTGGGAAILGIAQDPRGPGASAELFSSEKLRAGVALRIDRGRNSSDIDGLEDLPDVPASYALTPHWTFAATLAPDLLGRGGGTVGTLDAGWRTPLGPAAEWYAGAGLSLADARYMQSYYGVSAQTASATGRTAFDAGAGLSGARLGVGFTAALTSRWIAFGGVGVTRLLGDAAASPLTQRQTAYSASLGIAYRWGAKYEGLTSVLLPAAEQPR
jgi:outer membrane scaffolding protein for murein synthesis (MipA/OmpV family)